MPKTCIVEDCDYDQFGGGYCKKHQWKRKDLKPRSLKRTPIRKVSKNQQQILGEKRKLTRRDRVLFSEIWEEREHVDFETDEPIYGEPFTLYFHHVLEKENYSQFRYCKWNIIIIAWDTHTKAHSNLDLVPKIKAYRKKLIKTYL